METTEELGALACEPVARGRVTERGAARLASNPIKGPKSGASACEG